MGGSFSVAPVVNLALPQRGELRGQSAIRKRYFKQPQSTDLAKAILHNNSS